MKKNIKNNEINLDSTIYLFKRLFKEHISIYSRKIIFAVCFMILVAGATATQTLMIKPILDKIFFKQDVQMLYIIPGVIIVISIVKAISAYYQNYFMKYVGQRILTDMQARLYGHLIRSDIEYLNSSSSGMLISKLTNDISLLRNSMSNFLTGIAKELTTLIFLIGSMIYVSFTLSLITFVIFPATILPILKMGRRMRRLSNSTQEELGHYASKLDDTFKTIKIVKSFQREDYEINKSKTMLERIFSLYEKAIRTESMTSPMMDILSGMAMAGVVFYGGLQVVNGATSPGSFFAFIAAFITAYKPMKSMADLNNNLQVGLAAAKRLFVILDAKPQIVNGPNVGDINVSKGMIEIKQAKFNYPKSKDGVDEVSLEIQPGNIAFVGKSGSGKSTIINLLMRFYDLESGEMIIDGQNIKNYTLESLRENISYVSQDVMLFDSNILENIEYGRLGASFQDVKKAAIAADADEFINDFPDKYDTLIGQQGHKLSGGQKQRISIARALLKNSPIMIFDEATSALDNISERKIFDNLKSIRKGKTNIIVAHRLSTIIDADEIFVFKHGKIIERGSHKKLLAKDGEYSKLYKASLTSEDPIAAV